MSGQVPDATAAREAFDRLLRELRPKLHRYCARMTGSVVDGEDVVQEAQRSSVILMDVLGHSLDEIGAVMDLTIPAVKAALHRGRARLREIAKEPDDTPVPALAERERSRLAAYVDRFNARDFDAVRNMLADDVRLDLVAKLRLSGRSEVGGYFHNYSQITDWLFVPGLVDGRPAALVLNPGDSSGRPTYFVLLEWGGDGLVNIRDFRFARYAIE